MALLIANIGRSDIAVKIGDYFFPLGFNQHEKNLELPPENTVKRIAWDDRENKIRHFANQELGMNLGPRDKPDKQFRYITEKLYRAYQDNPGDWHTRISIGRIWGVIQTILEMKEKINIKVIVTDQPETEKGGYPSDSKHAYSIIETWIKREHPSLFSGDASEFSLEEVPITFSAIDEDALMEYYYDLFRDIPTKEVVYVSVKGGTPPMVQALKAQAIASNTKAQIFLSPQPKVNKILAGKASDCKLVAYWRYRKTQTYQAVKQLLERWDFDGARVLLQKWDDTLQSLIKRKVETVRHERSILRQEQQMVSEIISGLTMAVAYLNLDIEAVQTQLEELEPESKLIKITESYEPLTNLYAQCRILFELNQISYFLLRMGIFYEMSIHFAIQFLDGEKHFEMSQIQRWPLKVRETQDSYSDLWDTFINIHRKLIKDKKWRLKDNKQFEPGFRWDLDNYPYLYLKTRFLKKSFAKALAKVNMEKQESDFQDWEKLDFWYDLRNQISHGSKGVNYNRLDQVYKQDMPEGEKACPPDEILSAMTNLLGTVFNLSGTPMNMMMQNIDTTYGVYGQIREWAIATLEDGGLEDGRTRTEGGGRRKECGK